MFLINEKRLDAAECPHRCAQLSVSCKQLHPTKQTICHVDYYYGLWVSKEHQTFLLLVICVSLLNSCVIVWRKPLPEYSTRNWL